LEGRFLCFLLGRPLFYHVLKSRVLLQSYNQRENRVTQGPGMGPGRPHTMPPHNTQDIIVCVSQHTKVYCVLCGDPRGGGPKGGPGSPRTSLGGIGTNMLDSRWRVVTSASLSQKMYLSRWPPTTTYLLYVPTHAQVLTRPPLI